MFLLTVFPSPEYVKLEELGILADADDEGVLPDIYKAHWGSTNILLRSSSG
jgi:hypothetical protein